MDKEVSSEKLKYLQLLGEQFPTLESLCTEITRISAQLSLPKGTEHFMSDIHGEYEAFCHIMRSRKPFLCQDFRSRAHHLAAFTLKGG